LRERLTSCIFARSDPANNAYACEDTHKNVLVTNNINNFALRIEAGPPPIRRWLCHHNGRRLRTTGSERRTSFTTVDNTGGETKVVLGLQQLMCSDAKSNRRPY